jgi:hypothetical protein
MKKQILVDLNAEWSFFLLFYFFFSFLWPAGRLRRFLITRQALEDRGVLFYIAIIERGPLHRGQSGARTVLLCCI